MESGSSIVRSEIVVSNSAARQLVVELLYGNILDVEAQAHVVGIYEGVMPGGAAKYIDAVIDNKIRNAFGKRMFSGRLGEIYFLPCSRSGLPSDFVILAGLGDLNQLLSSVDGIDNKFHKHEQALNTVGANIVRAMVSSKISHAVTVLLGATTGLSSSSIVRNLTAGMMTTLMKEDPDEVVTKLSICEFDETRYKGLVKDVRQLITEDIPPGMNIRLTTREVKKRDNRGAISTPATRQVSPVYLFTSGERVEEDGLMVKSVVLGAGSKAAVFESSKHVSMSKINEAVEGLLNGTIKGVDKAGATITSLVLDKDIIKALGSSKDNSNPIVVVNDPATSFIPWECLKIQRSFPSLNVGMSRLLRTSPNIGMLDGAVKKKGEKIQVLLITDPTNDLAGARAEAEALKTLLGRFDEAFEYKEIGNVEPDDEENRASKSNILAEMKTGKYDIVHYAGHAFFDTLDRSKSGLVAHGNEIISSSDLSGQMTMPQIFFFNACESGRVRKTRNGHAKVGEESLDAQKSVERSISLAESIIESGINQFIGTYWPVSDMGAKVFSETFYTELIKGSNIGDSIRLGRKALRDKKNHDWADYIHYGDPFFQLMD